MAVRTTRADNGAMFDSLMNPAALAATLIVVLAGSAFTLYLWTWLRFVATPGAATHREPPALRTGCAAGASAA